MSILTSWSRKVDATLERGTPGFYVPSKMVGLWEELAEHRGSRAPLYRTPFGVVPYIHYHDHAVEFGAEVVK